MRKRGTVDQIKRAIKVLRRNKVAFGGTMMFGMVGENRKTIKETIAFCREMEHDTGFFWTTPYPGTEIYQKLKSEGKIKDEEAFFRKLSDAHKFVINLTEFSDAELKKQKKYLQDSIRIPITKKLINRIRYTGLWNLHAQAYDFTKRRLFPQNYYETKYLKKTKA
jgi:radical SAM superfamily enzyme YgiQ (UPF0313 family)